MRTIWPTRWLFLSALFAATSFAQSTPATQPAAGASDRPALPASMGPHEIDRRLDASLGPLKMDNVSARKVFAWWSESTGIDLSINWTKIEADGLDPNVAISIDVPRTSAERMLRRIMDKFSPDQKMIAERTEDGVEVMTRAEANRHRVLRLYDIRDLLPVLRETAVGGNTGGAGGGGASSSASATSGGGGGGAKTSSTGSGGKTFGSNADANGEIARLVRSLVEPDVWVENGGESTIEVFNGHLLVRAPLYVQVKIGQANAALDEDGSSVSARAQVR